jgi:hypothetical protein
MKIFVSYRRDDSSYATTAIYDQIRAHFGEESVFMDVASIPLGVDFVEYLTDWIVSCDVIIAVIGERWLDSRGPDGTRRLDDPGDFVRLELEAALRRDRPVVPVLVGGASMPHAEELPGTLQALSYRNAISIEGGRDFSAHVADLIRGLERFAEESGAVASDELVTAIEEEGLTRPAAEPAPPAPPAPAAEAGARGGVFISYRRDGGAETARLIRYELLTRGWDVFLDVENMGSGAFDETLLAEIERAENFLLIISPGSLERCDDERDWVRQEIVRAIEAGRNIVPLLKENLPRPSGADLPDAIEKIASYNAVEYSHVYYDATIEKLVSFLQPAAQAPAAGTTIAY